MLLTPTKREKLYITFLVHQLTAGKKQKQLNPGISNTETQPKECRIADLHNMGLLLYGCLAALREFQALLKYEALPNISSDVLNRLSGGCTLVKYNRK